MRRAIRSVRTSPWRDCETASRATKSPESAKFPFCGPVAIDRVTLYESRLSPAGPTYLSLGRRVPETAPRSSDTKPCPPTPSSRWAWATCSVRSRSVLLARRHRGNRPAPGRQRQRWRRHLLRNTTKKIGVSAWHHVGTGSQACWSRARSIPPAGPAVAGMFRGARPHLPGLVGVSRGKGVATRAACFGSRAPGDAIATLVSRAVWWTRYILVGFGRGLDHPGTPRIFRGTGVTVMAAIIVAAIIVHRNRSNLRLCLRGFERRLGGQSA